MHGSRKTKKDATIEQKYESFWEFTSCPFYQQYLIEAILDCIDMTDYKFYAI